MTRRITTIVLATLFLVTAGAVALGQHDHEPDRANSEAQSDADRCQMMAGHMQQMQAMMTKMDQRLDEKVEKMNQATGDDKIDAMADVINELVTQRQQMHERMAQMRQKMMGHMAQHMQMGMNDEGKEAMMHCPMMKQMMQGKPMTKYTCPMHPEVVQNDPGSCPKCGMALTGSADQKKDASSGDHNGSDRHGAHHRHGTH